MPESTLAVYLGGVHAGELTRERDGQVSFHYRDAYRLARTATPLSVSMPLDTGTHPPARAMPWIANLLPNNERVLERWAEHFGTSDTSAFGLLRHMGIDCAGAVQIVPVDEPPSTSGAYVALSDEEIGERIVALRADDAAWNGAELTPGTESESGAESETDGFGRWSLGGAQGKLALSRRGDAWALPTGRAPSTHILKVGVRGIADSDLAEYVTTRAAQAIGLTAHDIELRSFGDVLALVVTRFDRVVGADGQVVRIHQEDFCQALGVGPRERYEKSTTGPTLGDYGALISAVATPGDDLRASRTQLAEATAFTLLSLGTDAHAKNHALLHVGLRTRMAPLYDLGSAAFAYDGAQLLQRGKLPNRYGRSFGFAELTADDLVLVADDLGIARDEYLSVVRRIAEALPDAVADAVRQLPVRPSNVHFAEGPSTIARHAGRVLELLDAADVAAVERREIPRRYAGQLR